jgi:phosphoribosyl 1,2-cyclic phosphodiesterase/DNA-binding response OmpR family regulator
MGTSARIKFWGTRGSIARPGPQTLRYGGNTSCVEVTSPRGTKVIIDCGTGAFDLGRQLQKSHPFPDRGHLLISHTHWDHIQGFPFFAPLFASGARWDIYGPTGLGRSLRDGLAGQMEHTYFPVSLEEMGAAIHFHDLVEGVFEIDDIRITARFLNHTALTLGYRLDMDGVTLVYACDHEPHCWEAGQEDLLHELDRRHSEFLADADLVIHDAQFTDSEYLGCKGWGHSPVGYVRSLARRAGIKSLALCHHDPSRTDDELDSMVREARESERRLGSSLEVFAAADGQVVNVAPSVGAKAFISRGRAAAVVAPGSAVMEPLVLVGTADEELGRLLEAATESAGVRAVRGKNDDEVVRLARKFRPPLILLEDARGHGVDGLSVCSRLRDDRDSGLRSSVIAMVGQVERRHEGEAAGVTRWLLAPFSRQYARAQIQAWLLRTECRWERPRLPADEETRLAALHELAVLDSQPEERFDRLTRLAATVADVPVALISLVDQDRQWFKSCLGITATETSREVSFCGHAVVSGTALVVPDTLLDERFADNPLVVGSPRIRFYSGFPVFHTNGSCIGTLCLIDTRPRQLPADTLQRLQDLALLVQNELNAPRPAAAA